MCDTIGTKMRPLEVPFSTKLAISDIDAYMSSVMAKWIKKHGKVTKPKLTQDQREELLQVFNLMDDDGSGELGLDELVAAFKLLGFSLKKSEIMDMINEVDNDNSGEVGYDEFLQIMTDSLVRLTQDTDSSHQSKIPLALMATAYRRKKIMENLLEGTREGLSQVAVLREEEERARDRERSKACEAQVQDETAKDAQRRHGSVVGRAAEMSSLSPDMLRSFLSASEIRALAGMSAKKPEKPEKVSLMMRRSDIGVMRASQTGSTPHLPQLVKRKPMSLAGMAPTGQDALEAPCSERSLDYYRSPPSSYRSRLAGDVRLSQGGQAPSVCSVSGSNPRALMEAKVLKARQGETVQLSNYSLPMLRERSVIHGIRASGISSMSRLEGATSG